jgi:hypothetical protein
MRLEVSSFGTGPEPSLVRYFLPARGNAFACKLPSPQGGEAFFSSFPVKGKVLAWCSTMPCRAIHPGQYLLGAHRGHRS